MSRTSQSRCWMQKAGWFPRDRRDQHSPSRCGSHPGRRQRDGPTVTKATRGTARKIPWIGSCHCPAHRGSGDCKPVLPLLPSSSSANWNRGRLGENFAIRSKSLGGPRVCGGEAMEPAGGNAGKLVRTPPENSGSPCSAVHWTSS